MNEDTSFQCQGTFELRVTVRMSHLSLASYGPIEAKELTGKEHVDHGRATADEHLNSLVRDGIIAPGSPLLIVSARNVLANHRCGAWVKDKTEGLLSVVGEHPSGSERTYHALGCRLDGRLEVVELIPTAAALAEYRWLLTGVPVLWDARSDLFDRICTEAADHSHVWHLPRGNHPKATDETRRHWLQIHEAFLQTLANDRTTAYRAVTAAAVGVSREAGYLHNIVGVRPDGRLVQVAGVGLLEELGRWIGRLGVTRGLMLDNSGSTVVRFHPKGAEQPGIQMFAAPNHRPAGTAYLIFELKDSSFDLTSESLVPND